MSAARVAAYRDAALVTRLLGAELPDEVDEALNDRPEPLLAARTEAAAQRVGFELRVTTSGATTAEVRATGDGSSARVEVTATSTQRVRVEVRLVATRTAPATDPLMVDLNGDGVLTSTGVASGTRFDVAADGAARRTSWVGPGDAWLVWDRNGNGRIDDGRELFGDQHGATAVSTPPTRSGSISGCGRTPTPTGSAPARCLVWIRPGSPTST